MRLLGKSVLISQRPSPIGRQSGMPTGHRHCARIKSFPISRRSSGGRSFNHSRTGSVPLGVRKKINGVFCGSALAIHHHAQVVPRKVQARKAAALRGFRSLRVSSRELALCRLTMGLRARLCATVPIDHLRFKGCGRLGPASLSTRVL